MSQNQFTPEELKEESKVHDTSKLTRRTVKFEDDPKEEDEEIEQELVEDDTNGDRKKITSSSMNEKIDELFTLEYPDRDLYKVFILLFVCNVMVNIDHGTLPACVPEVEKKLGIENVGFGSLGTSVYAGLSVGSLLGTKLYQKTD